MPTFFGLSCRSALFAGLVAASLIPAPAQALPAIAAFETVGDQNNNSSANRTIGWIFTTLSNIAVVNLGVWDEAGDGLLGEHLVGIWNSDGVLLGSVTVQSGTASTVIGLPTGGGSFRYEQVGPILLTAGASYTIGALFNSDDIFEFNADSVTTGGAIAYGQERYSDEGDGFVMPTDNYGRAGLFGPNFQYVLISEPAAAGLFGLGVAGLMLAARRRQRAG
jgi:hypothetical protein